MKKTQEEIDTAVNTLTDLKSNMPRYSMFGDDNHKLIDLEIRVLKGELNEAEFYDMGGMIASQLLDVLEWRKGQNPDWFDNRLSDLENF